jgi:hypothetical protein
LLRIIGESAAAKRGLNVDERAWERLERLMESRDSEERADG